MESSVYGEPEEGGVGVKMGGDGKAPRTRGAQPGGNMRNHMAYLYPSFLLDLESKM